MEVECCAALCLAAPGRSRMAARWKWTPNGVSFVLLDDVLATRWAPACWGLSSNVSARCRGEVWTRSRTGAGRGWALRAVTSRRVAVLAAQEEMGHRSTNAHVGLTTQVADTRRSYWRRGTPRVGVRSPQQRKNIC